MEWYTGRSIRRLTGMNQRQVSYMVAQVLGSLDAKEPAGRGSARLYSELDAFKLAVGSFLKSAGMTMPAIVRAMILLSKFDEQLPKIIEDEHGEFIFMEGHYGCLRVGRRRKTTLEYEVEEDGNVCESTLLTFAQRYKLRIVCTSIDLGEIAGRMKSRFMHFRL